MTRQGKIREGIARRKLEIVTRCETRLIHSLSPKVQKQTGHELYTWETIPEHLKFFWLQEADKEMKELHSQGVVIKVERELPKRDDVLFPDSITYLKAQVDMVAAGYVAVEPLIEVKKVEKQAHQIKI